MNSVLILMVSLNLKYHIIKEKKIQMYELKQDSYILLNFSLCLFFVCVCVYIYIYIAITKQKHIKVKFLLEQYT